MPDTESLQPRVPDRWNVLRERLELDRRELLAWAGLRPRDNCANGDDRIGRDGAHREWNRPRRVGRAGRARRVSPRRGRGQR